MNAYKNHFLRMAIYNRWAFQQLYGKLDHHISDENYSADSCLFFRSIHGTLVHLLLSSELWYARLTTISSFLSEAKQYPYEINSYWSRPPNEWEESVTDRQVLKEKIFAECNRWITYIKQLNSESLMSEETFAYFDTRNKKTERTRAEVLDHVFNHNTHHRGQITAIITKFAGQDGSPVLDLTAMPQDEYKCMT